MAKKYVTASGRVVPASAVRPMAPGSSLLMSVRTVDTATLVLSEDGSASVATGHTTVGDEFVREVPDDAPETPFAPKVAIMDTHFAQRAALLRTLR